MASLLHSPPQHWAPLGLLEPKVGFFIFLQGLLCFALTAAEGAALHCGIPKGRRHRTVPSYGKCLQSQCLGKARVLPSPFNFRVPLTMLFQLSGIFVTRMIKLRGTG